MTVPRDVYDMIIEPIRIMDQREGHLFLKRWLMGPQVIWQQIDQNIADVPKLWSIAECPDQFLKYLKQIVGWTPDLDFITRDLTDDELRRLISISAELWKKRGSESTIVDVLFFATGARNLTWSWFDFRYVLPAIGPPEGLLWVGSTQVAFFIENLAGEERRDGMLWEATALDTGVTLQGQMLWSLSVGNYLAFSNDFGYTGTPSSDPNDYEIRLATPRDTELGELRQGRNPWMVSLPDPNAAGADYESNLRIVDDGTLDRALVVNLIRHLLRATGEKWEITYLSFLDRFIRDGDDTQWWFSPMFESEATWNYVVENGYLELTAQEDGLGDARVYPIKDSSAHEQAMYYVRAMLVDGSYFGIYHRNPTTGHWYRLEIRVLGAGNARLLLVRATPGWSTLVDINLHPDFPVYPDVYYGYRLSIVEAGSDKRIQVHIDGTLVVDYLDTSPVSGPGMIGLSSWVTTRFGEIECMKLPGESDYVDINS